MSHHSDLLPDRLDRDEGGESLRRSHEELQLAVRTARLGLWRLDLATGRHTWNEEMFRIYGIDRSQFGQQVADREERLRPVALTRRQAN